MSSVQIRVSAPLPTCFTIRRRNRIDRDGTIGLGPIFHVLGRVDADTFPRTVQVGSVKRLRSDLHAAPASEVDDRVRFLGQVVQP